MNVLKRTSWLFGGLALTALGVALPFTRELFLVPILFGGLSITRLISAPGAAGPSWAYVLSAVAFSAALGGVLRVAFRASKRRLEAQKATLQLSEERE